jgi:hypothetical protein
VYPVTHALAACAAIRLAEPAIIRAVQAERRSTAGIDYRFVAFGAILPDLIDKPLAWVLFRGTFNDSHLFGHTLLFSVSLIAAGLVLARRGELRLLLVGSGALMHLPLDPVIANVSTLFWPLLGWVFERRPLIPGGYMIALDAVLVAALAVAARRPSVRERIRRFVTKGEFEGS